MEIFINKTKFPLKNLFQHFLQINKKKKQFEYYDDFRPDSLRDQLKLLFGTNDFIFFLKKHSKIQHIIPNH